MRRRVAPLAVLLLAAAASLAAPSAPAFAGAAYSFYGSNAGGRTFNRPNVGSPGLSGKIVAYSSQPFFVDANATCRLQSVQEGSFDGVLYLYRGAFDPVVPLTNLVASSDNQPIAGFSEIPSVALQSSQNYYLVTSGGEPGTTGNFTSLVSCAGANKILAGDGTLPANDGRYGELKNGRFRVSGTWRNFQGQTGHATFVPLGSEETGVLWFFNPANFEVMIKVVDGCGLNNRYWVFFAALTNVEFHITVRDTWQNVEKTYDNTLGVSAAAITDTTFFQTCP
jgi:hypothetical protein